MARTFSLSAEPQVNISVPLSETHSLTESGIGYAVAEASLEFGANVIISSSSSSRVESAITKLQTAYPSAAKNIKGFPCDLSKEAELEKSIAALFQSAGPLDHVVFTAGEPIPAIPLSQATVENIKSPFTVRYTALVLVAKYAEKVLPKSANSSVTLTTGVVVDKPIPGWSVIAGPRFAVLGLGSALALDLKPIRVNTVCVGVVNTGTWAGLPEEKRAALFEATAAKVPVGKVAEASDVAELFLSSMKDTNLTGTVLRSNSGALLV